MGLINVFKPLLSTAQSSSVVDWLLALLSNSPYALAYPVRKTINPPSLRHLCCNRKSARLQSLKNDNGSIFYGTTHTMQSCPKMCASILFNMIITVTAKMCKKLQSCIRTVPSVKVTECDRHSFRTIDFFDQNHHKSKQWPRRFEFMMSKIKILRHFCHQLVRSFDFFS